MIRWLSYREQDKVWVVRKQVPPTPTGCEVCGRTNRYGKLFQYGLAASGMKENEIWFGDTTGVCSYEHYERRVASERD